MEGEGLLMVVCGAIIGNDNGGTLLSWSWGTTATRWEHQRHCHCSIISGCWGEKNTPLRNQYMYIEQMIIH